ncbi:hypothetical protein P7C71_g59, partial [Lecanoromycetidae sp. Uapishka_2]
MTSLEGKVVAITGAGSGIGKATAHLLAARGATISIADINKEPLEAVAKEIQTSNPKARVHHQAVNVTKSSEVAEWLDETVKAFGPLTSAVNLAGVLGKTGQIGVKDLSDEDWDFVMNVNLRGVFNCLRAELQRMEDGGSIVTSPSIDGAKLAIERRGRPEEVAKLIAFLLSEESTYTTGSCYTVDGGYTA